MRCVLLVSRWFQVSSDCFQILSCHRGLQDLGEMYQLLVQCLCGEVYDSGPMDFTSDQGVRTLGSMMANKGGVLRPALDALLNMGACSLDFFLVNQFESDRAAYWSTLGCSLVRGPVLFLYSDSDELAASSLVDGFSKLLRKKGREVWKKSWRDSTHVAHYRMHSQEYAEKVEAFLKHAVEVWKASSTDGEIMESGLQCITKDAMVKTTHGIHNNS